MTAFNGSPDWQILELSGKVKTPEVHGKLSDHNKVAWVEPLTQNPSLGGGGGTASLLLTGTAASTTMRPKATTSWW